MGIYYYLFAPESKECIELGKKGKRPDYDYEGPSIYVDKHSFLLPARYLDLLISRFTQKHGGEGKVIYLPDYELDSSDYLADGEDVSVVGGDRDFDIPVNKYLPEISNVEVQREIVSRRDLCIE
jgi:hypothetical protein